MNGRTLDGARVLAVLALTIAVFASVAAGAGAETVYNNLPTVKPGNTVSQGFECCQTKEFGGAVKLPNSTARRNPVVKVGLSSWACVEGDAEGNNCKTPAGSKFTLPITIRIYEMGAGKLAGAKVLEKTQSFQVPFRPTASPKCTTGSGKGGWYGTTATGGKACFHGQLSYVKFNVPGVLPESEAIVTLTYNTNTQGYEPTGKTGPSDSLNVALTEPEWPGPSIGSYANPSEDYANSTMPPEFEDPMCGGTPGVLGPTGACDTGYQPLFEIKAK